MRYSTSVRKNSTCSASSRSRMPSSRPSTVCQPVVISWRIWPSVASSSCGVRYGSIISTRCRAMLCSLRSKRAARHLGRVRHEHGLDADRGQRALDLVAVDALRLEPLQDVDEAERLRRARVAQIRAAAADAVHLLRHVDHLEVGRERADEIARRARRQRRRAAPSARRRPLWSPSRCAIASLRAVSTRSNSASPPCSRTSSPTSSPSRCTSSRSARSFSAKKMLARTVRDVDEDMAALSRQCTAAARGPPRRAASLHAACHGRGRAA